MSLSAEQILQLCEITYGPPDAGGWFKVRCPFHGDKPEMEHWHGGVSDNGKVFNCFVCQRKAQITAYIAAEKNIPVTTVDALIAGKEANDNGKIPFALLGEFHNFLMSNVELKEKLNRKHGIGLNEIVKYKLGAKGQNNGTFRITIPIIEDNKVVNLYQYSYSDTVNKMTQIKGGTNCLYLGENINKSTEVYIAEGLFKAIILNKYGFNACSPTLGAGNWDASWNEKFAGKDVVLVYDVDKAGQRGVALVSKHLHKHAKSVRNIILPLTGADHDKDVTDYFVKRNFTADDFRKLALNAPVYEPPKAPEEETDDGKVYDVKLSESSLSKFYGKRVKLTAIVSAKDSAPYIIPAKAQVMCQADKKYCLACYAADNRYPEFNIAADDKRILELIRTPTTKQHDILKAISGIYPGCKACTFKTLESRNVEELRLIPQISIGHSTDEMVTRRVFAVNHGIETNAPYEITAKVCVEPDTQYATLVAYESQKSTDGLDSFKLEHDLTLFQPSEWTKAGVWAKLNDLYEDLEHNVTRIFQRRNLHLFYDLVYHSALYIPFQGKAIKGWADALCIGDSGQGKSETSLRLKNHYQAGERVDSKQTSGAGLVGGLVENGKRWMVVWGVIPLNDRRLVILEEVKGAPPEQLGQMTDMRSSGVAVISKVEKSKTNARTRLIWISNPRSSRNIGVFNYGVDAVKELIGNLEDIRRFDMVMAVAQGDVALRVINQTVGERDEIEHHYTSDLCHHLVMWGWSRTEHDIILEDGCERELLDAATRMGEKYSAACPIVEPSDQRFKLLRLATALAIRTFSTEDGNVVIVRKCHVEVVEEFLDSIYADKALGYLDFSNAQKGESIMRDIPEIELKIASMPNAADSVKTLIDSENITTQTMIDCTEWMRENANEFIGFLVRKQALKPMRKMGGYRKTAAFIKLLKDMDRSGKLTNETLHATIQAGNL